MDADEGPVTRPATRKRTVIVAVVAVVMVAVGVTGGVVIYRAVRSDDGCSAVATKWAEQVRRVGPAGNAAIIDEAHRAIADDRARRAFDLTGKYISDQWDRLGPSAVTAQSVRANATEYCRDLLTNPSM